MFVCVYERKIVKDAEGFASQRLLIEQEMKKTDRKSWSGHHSCSQLMDIIRLLWVNLPHLRTLSAWKEVAGTGTEPWTFCKVNQSSVLVMWAQGLEKIPVLLPSVTSLHKVALFSYQGLCTHSCQTQWNEICTGLYCALTADNAGEG